jgi:hypothetical protein
MMIQQATLIREQTRPMTPIPTIRVPMTPARMIPVVTTLPEMIQPAMIPLATTMLAALPMMTAAQTTMMLRQPAPVRPLGATMTTTMMTMMSRQGRLAA